MCFVIEALGVLSLLALCASVLFVFAMFFDEDTKSITPFKVFPVLIISLLILSACGAIHDTLDCKSKDPCCCEKECK